MLHLALNILPVTARFERRTASDLLAGLAQPLNVLNAALQSCASLRLPTSVL